MDILERGSDFGKYPFIISPPIYIFGHNYLNITSSELGATWHVVHSPVDALLSLNAVG